MDSALKTADWGVVVGSFRNISLAVVEAKAWENANGSVRWSHESS